LIKEIEKRAMPVNRDSMVIVANDLRATFSPSYIVEQLYEQAKADSKNAIIESLRAVGEVEALKQKEDFLFFAIDADPKMRYERVVLRGSETDKISYDEFIANEQREMINTDPTKQNISKCMQLADHVFTNNGTLEELHQQIEEITTKLNI
jgi:dephospho-CoA kinase